MIIIISLFKLLKNRLQVLNLYMNFLMFIFNLIIFLISAALRRGQFDDNLRCIRIPNSNECMQVRNKIK